MKMYKTSAQGWWTWPPDLISQCWAHSTLWSLALSGEQWRWNSTWRTGGQPQHRWGLSLIVERKNQRKKVCLQLLYDVQVRTSVFESWLLTRGSVIYRTDPLKYLKQNIFPYGPRMRLISSYYTSHAIWITDLDFRPNCMTHYTT